MKNIKISASGSSPEILKITPPNGGHPLLITGGGEWIINLIGAWEFTHKPSGKVWKLPGDATSLTGKEEIK